MQLVYVCLRVCVRVCVHVYAGSESHVYLCLESLTYAGQKYKDRNDERVKQPTLALLSAHATRYGRTNDAVNTKLVMARTQVRAPDCKLHVCAWHSLRPVVMRARDGKNAGAHTRTRVSYGCSAL